MDFEELEELEAEQDFFLKYKPQGSKFPSRKAAMILILFLFFILIYFIWGYRNWRRISLSKVRNCISISLNMIMLLLYSWTLGL